MVTQANSIAFVSTPSLYFGVPPDHRRHCHLFEYDTKWKDEEGYHFYDFNQPAEIDPQLLGKFDMVVMDPPFITSEVIRNYAHTAKLLSPEGAP